MKELTSSTFDEQILASDVPVLVDFWAEWCGPCKVLRPVIEELAEEASGSMAVMALDIDAHPDIALRYQVMSVPTLLMFRRGEVVHRSIGAKPKSRLAAELSTHL